MLLPLAACAVTPRDAAWPKPNSVAAVPDSARVAEQPVCIGARSWSAGSLGETVLFRTRRVGRKIAVGYFVYWSEERPWGKNVASYTLLPALATDAVYSHFLYLFPGLKDAVYGPADVEGALVEFEERTDGSFQVIGGVADDAEHDPVLLSRSDLLDSKGRVVLLTDVWSHQLGAHGGAAFADTEGNELKCYANSALQPMTERVARAFRLGTERRPLRAAPAWLDPAEPGSGLPKTQLAGSNAARLRQ